MTTPEMEKDQFREVVVELLNKVKENASIDWTVKESVKAKLKVIVCWMSFGKVIVMFPWA